MNALLIHKLVNALSEKASAVSETVRPAEGGLLDTISTTNVQLLDVIKNLGITVVTILLLTQAVKAKMAAAAVIGTIFLAAVMFFGFNGGFMWLAGLLQNQFS